MPLVSIWFCVSGGGIAKSLILEANEEGQESLPIYMTIGSTFKFSELLTPWCWSGLTYPHVVAIASM